jgi:hypothetical protein
MRREIMKMEKDIIYEVQKRLLILFGQYNRLDERRWARKVVEWVPKEKRKHGWPSGDWRDDTKEANGSKEMS